MITKLFVILCCVYVGYALATLPKDFTWLGLSAILLNIIAAAINLTNLSEKK